MSTTVIRRFDRSKLPEIGSTVYVESFGNSEDNGGDYTRYFEGVVIDAWVGHPVSNPWQDIGLVNVKLKDFDPETFTGAFDTSPSRERIRANRGLLSGRPREGVIYDMEITRVFATLGEAHLAAARKSLPCVLRDLGASRVRPVVRELRKAVEAGHDREEIELILVSLHLTLKAAESALTLEEAAETEVPFEQLSAKQQDFLGKAKEAFRHSAALLTRPGGEVVIRCRGLFILVNPDGERRIIGKAPDCPECATNLMSQFDQGALRAQCSNCGNTLEVPPEDD